MANEYTQALIHGVEKTLPSGMVVRLRPVDTGMLLTTDLPQPLMEILQEQLMGIRVGKTQEQVAAEQLDEATQNVRKTLGLYSGIRGYGEIIARVCMVSPKVVDNPDPDKDEISARYMATDDLTALGNIVGLPLAKLIPFRFEPSKSLEPLQPGEGDLPVAEPGAEPQSMAGSGSGDGAGDVVDQLPVGQPGDQVRTVD